MLEPSRHVICLPPAYPDCAPLNQGRGEHFSEFNFSQLAGLIC
jgi:hypothetical protein